MTADRPALELAELREKSKKATPGPWAHALAEVYARGPLGPNEYETTEVADCVRTVDAEFIAAADPTTVLALLDAHAAAVREVEELRAVVERVRAVHDEWATHYERGNRARSSASALADLERALGGDL